MKEIFVAIIFIFDSGSGNLMAARTAVFESQAMCEASVAQVLETGRGDMTIAVEGGCSPAVLIPDAQS